MGLIHRHDEYHSHNHNAFHIPKVHNNMHSILCFPKASLIGGDFMSILSFQKSLVNAHFNKVIFRIIEETSQSQLLHTNYLLQNCY